MANRILLAEDERAIADTLADILADEGCDVTLAADGAAALALCDGDAPDLLITDQMMPNMTGAALIARLRQREWAACPAPRPLPVILLSAALSVAAIPPTVFLAKPFDLDHLLALVARLLAR